MDRTLEILKEYFRDIYAASESNCAGMCDTLTPASMGPAAYEIRRCCKYACVNQLKTDCSQKCTQEVLIGSDSKVLDKCVEICQRACRFSFLKDLHSYSIFKFIPHETNTLCSFTNCI